MNRDQVIEKKLAHLKTLACQISIKTLASPHAPFLAPAQTFPRIVNNYRHFINSIISNDG